MVAKNGMTIGKPPPTGVDRRPFKVVDKEDNTIIRCWYKETAEAYIKSVGRKDLSVEARVKQRLARRKKPTR